MWSFRLNPRQQLAVCLATVLVTAGTAGCTNGKPVMSQARTPDKVTYLTAFSVFGRETYVFTAKEKGFFAKRGIDVDIQAGNGASENLRILASGKAQFSANDLSGVMILQGQGKYTDQVRAVAAIQQQTLNSIMVSTASGITCPRDLEGHTIAGAPGATPQLLFPAYAKLAGFDPAKVHWVNAAAAQTLTVLASHHADGIGQFTVAVGTVTKAAGPVRVLPYSEVVGDLYGNALITTTDLIRANPDLVSRFRDALLEGLAYSLDHPDEAGQILHQTQPSLDAEFAADELRLMDPSVRSGQQLGDLSPSRVARAIAILEGTGLIPAQLRPEQVVAFNLAPGAQATASR